MINVTKSFLPDQAEYNAILKLSWDKAWVTNRGELVKQLEEKIKTKFKITNIIATTNGTLPLQIAIKALDLKGEIITTPFSYIATSSCIAWESCTPVFADIEVDTFNIDPLQIEAKINDKTTAIIATHVFGNPCNIDAIAQLAKKYNIKVIYDAAHAFGVTYKDNSIFEYGEVSTCSFHATKIFHTGEGGALFTKDNALNDKLYYHHNFGHDGPEHFHGIGINAKMSEFQAAMGLTVLPYFDKIIARRELLYRLYYDLLKENEDLQFQKILDNTVYNYAYFPLVFKSEEQLHKVKNALNENQIFPRRYFYPSLNTIPYLKGELMEISESISKRILCLPLYYDLTEEEVKHITQIVKKQI
ncbi:DegT/DnrJ/EryC1/StrS aminotransferase family protein [uncultured Psychroserpens sp.]|uniref:DegT/DnrJ/EryC1/StrS family aminotransferase n=1 Tax=uncultured Psychroserpens sp. TaxID=255436 RepID=UPI0026099F25|nr:DegT/DnrJ/EryC1/StrS family aminotransferase [uncultured Psychroserpens sp.]